MTNNKQELLIQKRSDNNFSLPGRWDQSAAGHVDKGESYLQAAKRELKEEMGVSGVALHEITKFYSEETDEAFIKKRFNVIFLGNYDGEIHIDNNEVSDYRWLSVKQLDEQIKKKPDDFTRGFINSFEVYLKNIENK